MLRILGYASDFDKLLRLLLLWVNDDGGGSGVVVVEAINRINRLGT